MQLKLLGIEGTKSIAVAAAATKGLSLEETTAALATTNLTEAEIAAVLVKNGFTKAISLKSAAQAIEIREQEAVAVETMATAAAETTATATTIGLTGATSGLTAAFHGLKAAISSNPIGFIATVAVTAITLIMSLTSQVESAAEKLDESSNEVKDIQGKISDLNGDLKTTNKRIEELERKPNLTIIEQTELDRLRTTNDELERQNRLQETALRTAQSKNASNFVSAVEELKDEEKNDNQEYYDTLGTGDAVRKTKSNSESFSWMLDWYKKSFSMDSDELYKATLKSADDFDTWLSDYAKNLQKKLDELGEYDYNTLSDEAKKAVDYVFDVQNSYLAAKDNTTDNELAFKGVYNQERFAEGKKAIEELKESGALTAETFASLYQSNDSVKAMIDNMQEVGVINDTTAGTFDNLTNQILGTKSAAEEAAQIQTMPFSEFISGKGVQDTIDSFKTKLTTLSDALEDFHNGDLSDSDLIDLFKEFPELANRTDDLDTALNELIDSTKIEIGNQFDSWNKSMPTDEDAEGLNAVKNSLIGIVEKSKDIEQLSEEIKKLNSALDSLQSTYNDIQGVIDDYNKNGYLTLDNLQSLMDLEPEYLNALIDENGQINLNTQAYKDYVAAKAKTLVVDQIKSLYEHLLEMSAEEAQAYANATAYNAETRSLEDLIGATTQYYLVLARAKDAKNNTTAYTDALRKSFGTVANYAAVYDSWLKSLSTSTNEFADKTDKSTDSLKQQKTALENQKKALENSKKSLENYKKGLDDAQDSLKDLIDLTIDYIKQIKENEKDALNKQKENFDELISKRKEALELAKKEREEADKLAEKQNSVVKAKLAFSIAQLDDSSAGKKAQKKAADNLKTANKDLSDYLNDREYNARVESLDKEKEAFDKNIDEQTKKIDEYLQNARQLYEDACNMIDNDTGDLYGKLWNDYVYPYTTKTRAEFDYLWNSAQIAIQKYQGDNETLIGVMNRLQGEIYATDTQINSLDGEIDNLGEEIDSTNSALDSTSGVIDNVATSLDGLGNSISDYIGKLNQLANTNVGGADNSDINPTYIGRGYDAPSGNYYYKVKFRGRDYYGYVGDSSDTTSVRERAYNAIMKEVYKYNSFNDVNPLLFRNAIVNHHAKGTKSSPGGLSIVDEEGLFSEFIPYQIGKGRYSFLPEGNPVFSKAMTNTMFDFASNPADFVNNIRNNSSKTNVSTNMSIVIQGNADRETVRKLKEFEKKYSNDRLMKMSLNNKNII